MQCQILLLCVFLLTLLLLLLLQGKAPPNVDIVRYQVVRLMRMLVQVCQTLDEVPEEVSC